MRLANPAGLLLGLLAVPVVLLHMLRPRRPAVEVSSTYLWREISRPVSAATPWQPLRVTLPLVLQLLAVAMLAIAAARPVRDTDVRLARHTVFIVDASASMGAGEGRPDRLGDARAEARALRSQLPQGGIASVVVASGRPRVALSASSDRHAFDEAIDAIRPDGGGADFPTAFLLAESLETPGAPIGFVLFSDGGLDEAAQRLIPPGTRYVSIGRSSGNQAVARLILEPRGSGLHARVTVRNTGKEAAERRLRVDVDGTTAATVELQLPGGASVERDFDIPQGERVEAALEGGDLLSVDDRAYAVAAPRGTLRVLLCGPPNVYIDRLLAAIPGTVVERSAVSRPANGFDVAIYAGVAVPRDPGAPFWAIAPPGGVPDVAVRGEVQQPAVTLVRTEDPLLGGLDLADVAIARAQRLEAPTDEVLVGAESAPLLVRGTRRGKPFAYLAFALEESNLPLQIAFPILGDRLLTTLSGTPEAPADLRAGGPLPASGGPLVARGQGRRTVRTEAGAPAPVADRPGFWTISQEGRTDRVFAVNSEPAESSLAPARTLSVRPAPGGRGRRSTGQSPLLAWVVWALIALLAAEMLVTRRTTGVPRRQRRAALGVRAAIAAALVLAAAGFSLPRAGTRVATIFLVDASDSMGADGREQAADWVRSALRRQPPGALAGVALYGGDARLELTMQERAQLVQPSTRIDASRTNLETALRLAAAVLPADARRRVVVVSDGRQTQGDAGAEARRLRADGIRVEVHTITRGGGADAAVVRIDAPSAVKEGESYVVRATIGSTIEGPVRATLRRDGETVDERTVDVATAETAVEFPQPPGPPGVHRFRLELSSASDSVPENNTAFAAVRVEGKARVLLVEGSPGKAKPLAEALRTSGLETDVVDPGGLPPLDGLGRYESTVLVDVDASSLGSEQVAALGAAVRDLGRGLVAIGGDRSFALGGYLGTELEKLLPVTSEVTDPKRRASVAEVLAIDTSGSMSACHCNPGGQTGFGGDRRAGGINKTDISRAAAGRAIRALNRSDQVGVLAFNTQQKWVIPLQQLPSADVIEKGLNGLEPAGGTNLHQPLRTAGEQLKATKAKLKHIILFTDGWSNQRGLADEAAKLRESGVTVSVLATGEGPGDELEKVAEAGGGRFYPGRNLDEIPEIMMKEAVLASRSFVNEGEFFPRVVADAAPVRALKDSPPLLGYVAATAKPSATTVLDVGEEHDPLLATWRVGLGRATAWTSDASARWAQHWASWNGYQTFWASVVKDTFPLAGAGGAAVRAEVQSERLRVTVEREQPWPDGAVATARLAGPDLAGAPLPLERTSPTAFTGTAPAPSAGSYAVGAEVSADGGTLFSGTALASQSYPPEYRLGGSDPAFLTRVSRTSGGRGPIKPAQAFDSADLPAGRGSFPLTGWLLLGAALGWPVDVALRRLAFHGTAGETAVRGGRATIARIRSALRVFPALPGRGRDAPADPVAQKAPPPTVRRLLERKRGGR